MSIIVEIEELERAARIGEIGWEEAFNRLAEEAVMRLRLCEKPKDIGHWDPDPGYGG